MISRSPGKSAWSPPCTRAAARPRRRAAGRRLMAQGLVGPHINIVHGNNLTDAQLKAFVDLGVSFSITPENEMAQGHGHPITGRLRALGSAPSVGVDLESAISGDMFTVARMALASQRALDNAAERASSGGIPADLDRAGGRGAGLDHHPGCGDAGHGRPHRQPGARQAGRYRGDVARSARHVAGARCRWPRVVMQGSGARVRDVLVAGRFAKRDGRLAAIRSRRRCAPGSRPRANASSSISTSRASAAQIAAPMKNSRSSFMRLVIAWPLRRCLPPRPRTPRPIPTSRSTSSCRLRRAAPPTSTARALCQRSVQEPRPDRSSIDNSPGAGGTIGAAQVAKCGARRLHAAGPTPPATPSIPRSIANSTYDTRKDLLGVSLLAVLPNILVACRRAGLEDRGRSRQGGKGCSRASSATRSAGAGSGTHMNAEKFSLRAGFDAVHVPYKGTPEALTDT